MMLPVALGGNATVTDLLMRTVMDTHESSDS
jgi:hypothetical protein